MNVTHFRICIQMCTTKSLFTTQNLMEQKQEEEEVENENEEEEEV